MIVYRNIAEGNIQGYEASSIPVCRRTLASSHSSIQAQLLVKSPQ